MGRVSDARERLIQAATELIWQQSYGAVTIDAICDKAGVKKGSFYYFFKSKSDLAVASLEAQWEKIRPDMDRIFSPTIRPLDRLRNYFDYISAAQKRLYKKFGHVMGCPYGCIGSEISQLDETLCAKVREIMSQAPKYLESALRDALAEQEIASVNPTSKAHALFAYMEGVLLQARIQNSVRLIETMPDGAMSLIEPDPARKPAAAA